MEWISVKDRLPEEGKEVLSINVNDIYPEYRIDYTVEFDNIDQPYIWARRLLREMDKVTHWMPLPKPPEE